MITGRARFPVARNRERCDIAQRRLSDLLDFRTRALAGIRKALQPELRPIMAGDADAAERLREKIAQAEALQARMKAANAAIRQHAKAGPEAQVKALVDLGFELRRACELLKPDFCGRIGFPAYALQNNNAKIRRMQERLKAIKKDRATPQAVREGSAARLEDCPAENRVRLFFPGKPAPEVRARLKAHGWSRARNNGSRRLLRRLRDRAPTQPGSHSWPGNSRRKSFCKKGF